MKVGTTISVVGHVGILLWSVISFAARPLNTPPMESLPVDIISSKEFTELTAGSKTAQPTPAPKPLAEKVAEKKVVDDPTPKVVDKPDIAAKTEATPPPPAPPPAKPTETKLEVKKAEPKLDPIADTLKQDDTKKVAEKKDDAKVAPPKPKPPIPVPPKFDPMKIAALLDKQQPQRQASAGEAVNRTASLGVATGAAAQMSQNEMEALKNRLAQLWNPPIGAKNPNDLIVEIRVVLGRDGKLSAPPSVLTTGNGKGPMFAAARDSAVRALFLGQPYTMLRQETYDTWKDMTIVFNPLDMLAGR